MKIHFLGGVDTVTGSQHLIECNGRHVLRDCGLYQGHREEARTINSRFAFPPETLDAVVLSHAHIDHCGNLPSLARPPFHAPIHATTATMDLAGIMLRDSARIQEQDAAYLNQKTNRRVLEPIVPLYTVQDAERALTFFQGHDYHRNVVLAEGVATTFLDAGHILGSSLSSFTLQEAGRTVRLGFALDLGRNNLPLIRNPEPLRGLDVLVVESTYGDRLHDNALQAEDQLGEVVNRTLQRGGKVLIPSFALERAQEIIYHLASLMSDGRLKKIPVFVDSPMADAVSGVFEKSGDYLDDDFTRLRAKIGSVMRPQWLRYISSVEESKKVTASDAPCVIIAASGMCEYGRILHHLKHGIENGRNTIVLVGFQAENTLGRRLSEGEKKVRIFGDWFERQAEVKVLNAFSAHADRNELVEYIAAAAPGKIFLVHGESHQREGLAAALKEKNIGPVFLPKRGEAVDL